MLHAASARNRRIGIGLLTLATLMFATPDGAGRWLVLALPVAQVVWLRFVAHALISTLVPEPVYGRELVTLSNWRLQLLRGATLCVMTGFNFRARQHLQLAEVAAIQFPCRC
jgi:drug/metabolite transporter (DMT)-like permease